MKTIVVGLLLTMATASHANEELCLKDAEALNLMLNDWSEKKGPCEITAKIDEIKGALLTAITDKKYKDIKATAQKIENIMQLESDYSRADTKLSLPAKKCWSKAFDTNLKCRDL